MQRAHPDHRTDSNNEAVFQILPAVAVGGVLENLVADPRTPIGQRRDLRSSSRSDRFGVPLQQDADLFMIAFRGKGVVARLRLSIELSDPHLLETIVAACFRCW